METDNGASAFDVFLILICVLGIIGNLIVIVIILVFKEYKKTVTHWYILQLAIADALFVTTIPLVVSQQMNDSWYFGERVCKFKEAMLFINYYASIMFLMVMSIDRYLAICHAFNTSVQNFRKPIVSYIIIVIVWILAILLSTPIIIYSHQGRENGNCACKTKFPPTHLDNCLKTYKEANAEEICSKLVNNCRSQSRNSGNSASTNPTSKFPLKNFNFFNSHKSASNGSNSFFAITKPTSYELPPSTLHPSAQPFPFPKINFLAANQNKTRKSLFIDFSLLSSKTKTSDSDTTLAPPIPRECKTTDDSPGWRGYVWFNFIVMFILPLMVMVFCYGMISNQFWNTNISKARRRRSSSLSTLRSTAQESTKRRLSNRSAVDRDRRRVSIMCAVLVATFALCWVLYHSVHIAKLSGIHLSAEGCRTITLVSFILVFLNSALNPFLYSFLGTGCQRKWKLVRESSAVRRMTTMKTRSSNDGNREKSVRSGSGCMNKMLTKEQPTNSNVTPEMQCDDENGKTEMTGINKKYSSEV